MVGSVAWRAQPFEISGMSALRNRGGLGAELIERALQFRGDVRRLTVLNVAPMHHVDYLAVAQQRNRGRGWRISRKIGARAVRRLFVLSGKYGEHFFRTAGVLQRC